MSEFKIRKQIGKRAGLWYIATIIFGAIAQVIRSGFIVANDPIKTSSNIQANSLLFRISIISDLAMIACYIITALTLYPLFSSVNKEKTRMFTFFTAISAAVLNLNMINQFAPLIILNETYFADSWNTAQINGMVYFFFQLHDVGYTLGQLFYGLWLLPLGLVVLESDYLPRSIGYLLVLASIGHVMDMIIHISIPNIYNYVFPITSTLGVLGEFSFAFYLLIKGVKADSV